MSRPMRHFQLCRLSRHVISRQFCSFRNGRSNSWRTKGTNFDYGAAETTQNDVDLFWIVSIALLRCGDGPVSVPKIRSLQITCPTAKESIAKAFKDPDELVKDAVSYA